VARRVSHLADEVLVGALVLTFAALPRRYRRLSDREGGGYGRNPAHREVHPLPPDLLDQRARRGVRAADDAAAAARRVDAAVVVVHHHRECSWTLQ